VERKLSDLPALREAVAKHDNGTCCCEKGQGYERQCVIGALHPNGTVDKGVRELPALLDELEALRVELDIEKKLHARAAEAHAALLDEREAERIENKKLEGAVTQMSRAARSLEKKLEAEKAALTALTGRVCVLEQMVEHYGWCRACGDGPDCDHMTELKAQIAWAAKEPTP
jgi:hypothetical protein